LVDFQEEFVKEHLNGHVDLKIPSISEETFSGAQRELIRPMASKKFVPIANDTEKKSKVNLASLVLMFEYQGKRFLFTSDAYDFQVLEGLHEAGYLDRDGKVNVDVLEIPHQGSNFHVSEEFFKRVIATHYIITGDGKLGNPEEETLQMLTDARQSADYTLQFAYRVGKDGLGEKLEDFFGRARIDRKYRRIFRPPDEKSLIVNLLDPVRY
jgi:hypothetical protein